MQKKELCELAIGSVTDALRQLRQADICQDNASLKAWLVNAISNLEYALDYTTRAKKLLGEK